MAKITLTRALVELKTLDARISNTISLTCFVGIVKGTGDKQVVVGSAETPAALEQRIRSGFQSLDDLIIRRNKIKAELVQANATTPVTIAGCTYTIAGAIEYKRAMEVERQIVMHMRAQLAKAEQIVQQGNTKMETDIETAAVAAAGGDKKAVSTEVFEMVAAPRRAMHKHALLDPANLRESIEQRVKLIEAFAAECDVALSEVNARTEIEVN
jgi:hypothetical protein